MSKSINEERAIQKLFEDKRLQGNEIERPQHVDRTIDLRFGSLNDQVGRRLFWLSTCQGKTTVPDTFGFSHL